MTVRLIPVVLSAINTPVELVPNVVASGANLILTNGSSANPIFIGSSSVTTSNGVVIPPYGIVSLRDVIGSQSIWATAGVIDAGGTKVGVIYADNQIA